MATTEVLLVGGDLNAQARVFDAAARVGARVAKTTHDRLGKTLEEASFDLVVVDLDEGRRTALDALAGPPRGAGRVVGFFSHVDSELGDEARRAGVEALPRSRFWRGLDDLLASTVAPKDERGEGKNVSPQRDRPASPEQPEDGFEEGLDHKPDEPSEERVGRFSEGQEDLPDTPEKERKPRFSEGEEELPDTPEKVVERRFSEGQEGDDRR